MWFRVRGSGFRVQGLGFRVQGLGCRVQGLGWGEGRGMKGAVVEGFGFRGSQFRRGVRI